MAGSGVYTPYNSSKEWHQTMGDYNDNVIVPKSILIDTADAIRLKRDGSASIETDTYANDNTEFIHGSNGIVPEDFATEIGNLQTGHTYWFEDLTAMTYPTRTQVLNTNSSTGNSTDYIRGLAREYATGAELVDTIIKHPFCWQMKTYSSPSYNYYSFIWTPDGYEYAVKNNFLYWRPTFSFSHGSMSVGKLDLTGLASIKHIGYLKSNNSGIGEAAPAFKISELKNNSAAAVYSITSTSTTPQIYLYDTSDVNTKASSQTRWLSAGGQSFNYLV